MATSLVHVEYQQSDSGSDADLEPSDDDSNGDEEAAILHNNYESVENNKPQEKHGLADVMAKILHKSVPNPKKVILAKGQTDKEIRKRKLAVEEKEDEQKKERKDTSEMSTDIASGEKKKLWEDMCHVKPNILEKEKERSLQRIATRGVVQLFNAVRKQQKTVEEEVQKAGSDRKKEKVMEKITKNKFLSMLKGSSVSNVEMGQKQESLEKKSAQKQAHDEKEKKWSILRDDYMMGAKMKDWNKEASDDDNDDDPGNPEMSDSD